MSRSGNEQTSLNVFRQPKPFYLIFSIEFWERFGFYGLQAIFAIYLVKHIGMNEEQSIQLFASFTALVYALVSVGGWLGDKILGSRRIICLGSIILSIGYLVIALSPMNQSLIYPGMAAIAVGSGLFKANPSALLSTCYAKDDPRLDGAFTMFYMSINIGSLFSMIVTPWAQVQYGWSVAYLICFVGLVITVGVFVGFMHVLKGYGSVPDQKPLNKAYLCYTLVGIGVALLCVNYLLHNRDLSNYVLLVITCFVLIYYIYESFVAKGLDRKKMYVALVLMFEAMVFYVLYMQMPTSLNFFAIHNVTHDIFGMRIEPEQFQALNPFWIMLGSPLMAMLYNKLGRRFTLPQKFTTGMFLCSFAFLVLVFGARFTADARGIVSSNWLILSYFLQAIGELMISGLGLSMVAQLVPQRLMGFMMGAWFLTTSVASVISGHVAALMAVPEGVDDTISSLGVYQHVFMQIGLVTLAIACAMLLGTPALSRMLTEKSEQT